MKNIEIKKIIVQFFLFFSSIFAAIGILSRTDFGPDRLYLMQVLSYNKLVGAIIAAAFIVSYNVVLLRRNWPKKDLLFAVVVSFAFALTQTVGLSFAQSNGWDELTATKALVLRGALAFWGWMMFSFVITLGVFYLMDKASELNQNNSTTTIKGILSGKKTRGVFWKKCGIIWACYMPYLIALFPGTSNGDTVYQISEYFGFFSHSGLRSMSSWGRYGDFMHNHHPYFTTCVFGFFSKIGRLLTGNKGIAPGVFLFAVMQIFFVSVLVVSFWDFLVSEGLNPKIYRIGFIFTALYPGFPLVAICMIKDSIYSILIIWATLQLFKIVRSKGEILGKTFFVVRLNICALLISLTRSQGVYVVFIIAVVLLIIYRKKWLSVILGMIIPCFFVAFIWVRVLLPAWNVAPAGHQETIGPLMQQTARYVVEHGDEVTKKERKTINRIMSYDKIADSYCPTNTDPIKLLYRSKASKKKLNAYYKVWFGMMLKHPKSYIDATINTSYTYFCVSHSVATVYKHEWSSDRFSRDRKNGLYADMAFPGCVEMVYIFLHGIRHVPILELFFNIAFYTWVMFLTVIIILRKKSLASIIPMGHVLLCIVLYVISPHNTVDRYAWPVIMLTPFILASLFLKDKVREHN